MIAAETNAPVQPTWDQLMNGSLDSQFVEVTGMLGSIQNRKDDWSVAVLRTKKGDLKVVVLRTKLKNGPLEKHVSAVIRVRGHLTVDRDANTQRVITGQIRMRDAEIFVEQPAPADPFSVPAKTLAALARSDPDYDPFRWVKVSGQIIHVRSRMFFLTDGENGLRFVTDTPLESIKAGDLVEVVGYQDVLSAAAPVLRGAVARKTGVAALPKPKFLSTNDLVKPVFDSRWVQVEGTLANVRQTGSDQVLEIHNGVWRFWARLNTNYGVVPPIELGSRLQLTGAYCAQGEYRVIGPDVAALDLLLNSPGGIKVLSRPSWWTLQRLLVVVGVLVCLLVATVLWNTQLHRQVQRRSAELAAEIRERQRIEHQHALERERARIAQDLHDELGAGITEMGMMAARAGADSVSEEKRNQLLKEMCQRSLEMVTALDEIVWAMNPAHDSVASLVSYFSIHAGRFLTLANIKWHLQNGAPVPEQPLDSPRRHQLFLAFKEALNNVVRHSGATEVRFGVAVDDGHLRLEVSDNGRGLKNAQAGGVGGMANMRSRLEKLGGRFEMVSEPGRGTTVKFFLPMN